MKTILYFVLCFGASVGWLHAQTYNMPTSSVTSCSGSFFDSGGSTGDYGNNENRVFTICATAGSAVRVTFSSFDVEDGWDFLDIYGWDFYCRAPYRHV